MNGVTKKKEDNKSQPFLRIDVVSADNVLNYLLEFF